MTVWQEDYDNLLDAYTQALLRGDRLEAEAAAQLLVQKKDALEKPLHENNPPPRTGGRGSCK